MSQSSAMQRWNDLTVRVKHLEKQLHGLTGEAKEVRPLGHSPLARQAGNSPSWHTAYAGAGAGAMSQPDSICAFYNAELTHDGPLCVYPAKLLAIKSVGI